MTTQPKNLAHRCDLATVVHEELLHSEVEVVVDDMSNSFQKTMACWPIRMFVVNPNPHRRPIPSKRVQGTGLTSGHLPISLAKCL